MGAEQLSDLLDVLDVVDLQKHDREVAGYRMLPEAGLRTRTAQDGVRGRPEPSVGIDERCGKPLEVGRFLGRDADVTKLHLGLRPG